MTDEVPLEGGQINRVVRVGDTVRHPGGPWTETIHTLLRHLRERGFEEAPEPLGIDDQGRSVLRWIEGDIGWWPPDDRVIEIGRLVRRYHDAVADFVPPPGAPLRFRDRWPGEGEVLGHHDIAPWNVLTRGDRIVALLDWDMIGGAPPVADLAYAMWRYAFLSPDEHWHGRDESPGDRMARAAAIAEGYGLAPEERVAMPAVLALMLDEHHALIHRWGDAGHAGFLRILGYTGDLYGSSSFDEYIDQNRAWLRSHRSQLARALA